MTLESLVKEKARIQRNNLNCLEAKSNLSKIRGKLISEDFGALSQQQQNRINRNLDSILDILEPIIAKQQTHLDNLTKTIIPKDSSGLAQKTAELLAYNN